MDNVLYTDVLVIGAGIAGVTAAINAARVGTDCTLVASSSIFSGASFFKGTWGFGLIGPENADDAQNLQDTILRIGSDMADPVLAETLVGNIPAVVRALQDSGMQLRRPKDAGEREFIPCFDYKNRDWYGVVQQDAKETLTRELDAYGVRRCPNTQILALRKENGRVCGALALRADGFLEIVCKSVVIACGGLAGLYRHAFGSPDCCGLGQLLALEAGASLVNMEFHQMMPGFVRPCAKTIYNEKVFHCSSFFDAQTGVELFADLDAAEREALLRCRSGHGPFTSRLPSKEVDLRIFARFMQQEDRVALRYSNEILENPPEFVKVYFDWLRDEKGLTPQDEVRIGIFYHAANGGIRIDKEAFTGVEGLYACGEATGGMHGADRLGGLSIANGLVFGTIAGKSAAAHAKEQTAFAGEGWRPELRLYTMAQDKRVWLCNRNFAAQMLARDEETVRAALSRAQSVMNMEASESCSFLHAEAALVVASRKMEAAAALSEAVLTAVLMRRESRGSHYRSDYPQESDSCKMPTFITMRANGKICAH